MTIGELKEMIADLPEDMNVVIPLNAGSGFDGMMFSPCVEESGVGEGEFGSEEEYEQSEKLGIPLPTVQEFILVPCGFFDEPEGPDPELN